MLRQVSARQQTVWLVTSSAEPVSVSLTDATAQAPCPGNTNTHCVQVGEKAFIQLAVFTPDTALSAGHVYEYALHFAPESLSHQWQQEREALLYPGQHSLNFVFQPTLTNVLHGSCRKPHHPVEDALLRADGEIAATLDAPAQRPQMLLMTGDQVYCDDVAGPMLQAIEQVIARLGLFAEPLEGAVVSSSAELADHPHNYYEREQILPQVELNTALSKTFFGAKKKPVFTSVNAHNHLISLSEVLAMYILVWSDTLWGEIVFDASKVGAAYQDQFAAEQPEIEAFAAQLGPIRRALAHVPVYMIFDDHDVTDDWNLTRGWEEAVYNHPLSRRMVGNALIGYWLCQGWGNAPQTFDELYEASQPCFTDQGLVEHDALVDRLFEVDHWHFTLETTPPVCVLDTRTHRWRSESNKNKPSGLMDWEALCEFQQQIIGKESVIVVSAAPIYGVKLIETIQKVFTFMGKALTVDAENWMAHRGTAQVMLNIFRHVRTPPDFIILSGDVHYSFVYDVRLRFRRNSPHITQFTCSGLKNTFPNSLLRHLERINRALYGATSPLNLFTRRRNMSVQARPASAKAGHTLLNHSALGQLVLRQNDHTVTCKALCGDQDTVEFPPIAHDE